MVGGRGLREGGSYGPISEPLRTEVQLTGEASRRPAGRGIGVYFSNPQGTREAIRLSKPFKPFTRALTTPT